MEWVSEAFFPTRCVACASWGAWFCDACIATVEHAPDATGWGDLSLDVAGSAVLSVYHNPRIRALIHALKYQGATCVCEVIERVLTSWLSKCVSPLPWVGERELGIQPLLCAPSRRRRRGYDQAHLLSVCLRTRVVPWAVPLDCLERIETPFTQVELATPEARARNVVGAFRVRAHTTIPQAVLLVDDVITTGATVQQAAAALRAVGVSRVYAWALARGT